MEVNKEFKQKYCRFCGSQRCTGDGEWLDGCEHYKNEQKTTEEIKIDIPNGYELAGVDDNNQQVVFINKIQHQYPKTYEECCKVLGCKSNHFYTNFSCDGLDVEISEYEYKVNDLLKNFRKLIYCRDAYWKIAGDWKPDWTDSNFKYCIKTIGETLECVSEMNIQCLLAFPTEEIRNIFYNNFKNTIEKCKELL